MSLPEIQGTYSDQFRRILASGFFGRVQPFGLEAIVYSTQSVVDKVLSTEPLSLNRASIKRIVECELLIDPMQMKSLHKWLETKIKEYEKIFGIIPSPEEVDSRARRQEGQ
ncbi:MAG: hypothetical protein WD717_06080 [Nitrosarchaeum sp.]